ncbi:MAG: hypothetical protein WDN76_14035 [Alphaproteobacteria bacterium]
MEDNEPFDLETAWADLQHAIVMMLASIGGCALAVAERLILTRAARIEILQWLAPLEAEARRLLVLEALKLPAPNQPPPFVPKGKLATAYADKPAHDLPEDETQWRVRFHVWSGGGARQGRTSGVQTTRTYPVTFNAPVAGQPNRSAAPRLRSARNLRCSFGIASAPRA